MLAAVVASWERFVARWSLPQRLAWASVAGYTLVLGLLLVYGRPGSGMGQLFFVPIVLAALAGDVWTGTAAGAAAAVLYLAVSSEQAHSTESVVLSSRSAFHLVSYLAAGAIVGAFARRARGLLAESLQMLDELLEFAHRDPGSGALSSRGLDASLSRGLGRGWPFALLLGDLEPLSSRLDRGRFANGDGLVRDALRRLAAEFGTHVEVARAGPTRVALLVPATSPARAREAAESAERAFARNGRSVTFGWAFSPVEGADGLSLVQTASERMHARRIVRGEWQPTAASAGLIQELPR